MNMKTLLGVGSGLLAGIILTVTLTTTDAAERTVTYIPPAALAALKGFSGRFDACGLAGADGGCLPGLRLHMTFCATEKSSGSEEDCRDVYKTFPATDVRLVSLGAEMIAAWKSEKAGY